MLFGIMSRCDSMTEACEGIKGLIGKPNHLKIAKAPAISSAGDGLRNRDNLIFQDLPYELVECYRSLLSVSRLAGLSIEQLDVIDSTTISHFSDNQKGGDRKKGCLKAHMLIDAVQSVEMFMCITDTKTHDKNFLKEIQVPRHSMLVIDKAYNYYRQFTAWPDQDIYFVTYQKDNAVYMQ